MEKQTSLWRRIRFPLLYLLVAGGLILVWILRPYLAMRFAPEPEAPILSYGELLEAEGFSREAVASITYSTEYNPAQRMLSYTMTDGAVLDWLYEEQLSPVELNPSTQAQSREEILDEYAGREGEPHVCTLRFTGQSGSADMTFYLCGLYHTYVLWGDGVYHTEATPPLPGYDLWDEGGQVVNPPGPA